MTIVEPEAACIIIIIHSFSGFGRSKAVLGRKTLVTFRPRTRWKAGQTNSEEIGAGIKAGVPTRMARADEGLEVESRQSPREHSLVASVLRPPQKEKLSTTVSILEEPTPNPEYS
jgi:hypothetical protein